ncbi:S-adenosyl-L-methionine-dependent methyltransferase [Peniophora sp. CONT]|nr:S-adenosyl-L-methionine-dependent methyltransferase [Peniophora sp. CONT]
MIQALEFYSGVGGLHLALTRSNVNANVTRAYDWDQLACSVYSANHGQNIAYKTDISSLKAPDIPDSDLWLCSPACQPYTVLNPDAKGARDPRAASFLHLMTSVLPDLARADRAPGQLLVENVAGFENSTTRTILRDTLAVLGYHTFELLLTPLQFGIPNSRLRYYLIARRRPFASSSASSDIHRHIPGHGEPWADPRHGIFREEQAQTHVDELSLYLDPLSGSEGEDLDPEGQRAHEYAIPDRVLEKWGRLFDIVLPSARRTCCFTRGYTQLVERAGSILQENTKLDTTKTFDAFLSAQSRGEPKAVDILRPLRLRYFTPSELLRLFAFMPPREHSGMQNDALDHGSWVWPQGVSRKVQYRLLGNSVNVRVVQALVEFLFEPAVPGSAPCTT